MPRVTVKIPTNHITVLGPIVACIGCVMNAEESFSAANKVENSLFLFVVKVEIARRGKDQQVELFKSFRRNVVQMVRCLHAPILSGTNLLKGDFGVG